LEPKEKQDVPTEEQIPPTSDSTLLEEKPSMPPHSYLTVEESPSESPKPQPDVKEPLPIRSFKETEVTMTKGIHRKVTPFVKSTVVFLSEDPNDPLAKRHVCKKVEVTLDVKNAESIEQFGRYQQEKQICLSFVRQKGILYEDIQTTCQPRINSIQSPTCIHGIHSFIYFLKLNKLSLDSIMKRSFTEI